MNPDTLRYSVEPTGLLSIGTGGIEVQIEVLGAVDSDWVSYVNRASQLLESVLVEFANSTEPEPEIEPGTFIPPAYEPDPESTTFEDQVDFQ